MAVSSRPSPGIDLVEAVGDQAALGCENPIRIDCRQAMPRRQYDDRSTVRPGVLMWHDDEAAVGLASNGSDRALDRAAVTDVDRRHRDAKGRRDRIGHAQVRYIWGAVRTEEHSRPAQVGRRLLEHSQPLASHRRLEGLEARDIATRPRKTG